MIATTQGLQQIKESGNQYDVLLFRTFLDGNPFRILFLWICPQRIEFVSSRLLGVGGTKNLLCS
jgi:hypothetical protein